MATPPAPTSIAKALARLTKTPTPILPSIRSLTLTLAQRNAHFGARHFVKEELPRIAYNNPSLKIDVQKKPKAVDEKWDPEIVVQFADGASQTINMQLKHSSKILAELMALGERVRSSGPKSSI